MRPGDLRPRTRHRGPPNSRPSPASRVRVQESRPRWKLQHSRHRVAHNRCVDHLRRPLPPAAEVLEMARGPLPDPLAESERREDLKRLVADMRRLPTQQRSVLLMRELEVLSYADLATTLDVTVP